MLEAARSDTTYDCLCVIGTRKCFLVAAIWLFGAFISISALSCTGSGCNKELPAE